MTLEEYESKAKAVIEDHLEGKINEGLPDFLKEIQEDYMTRTEKDGEYKEKYEEIKRKYIERFFGGEEKEEMNTSFEQEKREKDMYSISIDDLMEE